MEAQDIPSHAMMMMMNLLRNPLNPQSLRRLINLLLPRKKKESKSVGFVKAQELKSVRNASKACK